MHLHLIYKQASAIICGLIVSVSISAQTVSRTFRDMPLNKVLEEIERQTGYTFIFENAEIDPDQTITATFKDA